jgi:hypothetical protein
MNDLETYKARCREIRKVNEKLIFNFEKWLRKKEIKEDSIRSHSENVSFFINQYLLNEETIEAKDGPARINIYLGGWFIERALWACSSQIKMNAASIKKFYTFLHEKKIISTEALDNLIITIKEEMPLWLETMGRFDKARKKIL